MVQVLVFASYMEHAWVELNLVFCDALLSTLNGVVGNALDVLCEK